VSLRQGTGGSFDHSSVPDKVGALFIDVANAWGGTLVANSYQVVDPDDPWRTISTHRMTRADGTQALVEVRNQDDDSQGSHLCDHSWHRQRFFDKRQTWGDNAELVILYLTGADVPESHKVAPDWALLDATWGKVWHFYRQIDQREFAEPAIEPTAIDLPSLSIITVVYDGFPELEQTIQSVLAQDYPNVEYVVVDGASRDGTSEILERYRRQITAVVSQPDDGVFDGMNTGWELSTGDFMLFLNSGDVCIDPTVMRRCMEAAPDYGRSFVGSALIVHPELRGAVINSWKARGGLPHQALFMHRKQFGDLRYDTTFSVVGDSELWDRFFDRGHDVSQIDIVVAMRRLGGISLDARMFNQRFEEHARRGHKPHAKWRLWAVGVVARWVPQSFVNWIWFRKNRSFGSN